jgi:hypothetical protein
VKPSGRDEFGSSGARQMIEHKARVLAMANERCLRFVVLMRRRVCGGTAKDEPYEEQSHARQPVSPSASGG